MPTELLWITRSSTVAWAWLDSSNRGVPIQAQFRPEEESPLSLARQEFARFLAGQRIGGGRVAQLLLPLSAEFDSPPQLAAALLPKLLPREQAKAALPDWTSVLRSWEHAFATALPKIADELPLRLGPIRELAESYLPGLLHTLSRIGDQQLLPSRARIVVIPPFEGGLSRSFPLNNTVLWEGLLANVEPRLPEVLRLCWAIAQLNLEMPCLIGNTSTELACRAGSWGMIPLALHAGSELELCRCDHDTAQLAAMTWLPEPWNESLSTESTMSIVWNWWETYAVTRPAWPIAIGALIKMLDAE